MQLDPEKSEEEIVDNYRTDTLYTHKFKNDAGKYFTIVSRDENNIPDAVEAEHPYPLRNKIKTTFTFIKENNKITKVSFKRFKYYKNKGYVAQDEQIVFSFSFFKQIIDYLKLLSELNLADINERRITLAEDDLPADDETKKKIKTFLLRKDGQQIIEEVLNSGIITSTDIVNIGYRKQQLEIFKKLLEEDYLSEYKKEIIKNTQIKDELAWQYFFNENPWIFGYGLDYRFMGILQKEFSASGTEADGSGQVNGDFLIGDKKFTTFVELKKPDTPLFKNSTTRSGAWKLSTDLMEAKSQILEQKASGQIKLEKETIHDSDGNEIKQKSYDSKVILILGNWDQIKNDVDLVKQTKTKTFELFRRDSRNVEIITFDELFERAKFIVENKINE
jgi:hypothetical protein